MPCPPGAVPCNRGPCVAEKSPLRNRVRRHFAWIKAGRRDRGQSWLLWQIGPPTASRGARDIRGRNSADFGEKSGNVGAVSRGDQAAHHPTSDFGLNARTTGGF